MPTPPLLYDAVTLRHFSSCQSLALCELIHSPLGTPHWVEAVKGEIERAAALGLPECPGVLTQAWLGTPATPTLADQPGIVRVWIALNGGQHSPKGNAGEAQSIYFAQQIGGTFATDDNAAYDFAAKPRRLGAARVIDTVDILRQAVAEGHLSAADAVNIAVGIRRAGRFLRHIHPMTLTEGYFR
jgi:hypothetical protein